MNPKQTWLQCVNSLCSRKADLLKERKFRCECGSLYDMRHDFDLFFGSKKAKKNGLTPKNIFRIFDERAKNPAGDISNNPLTFSGVWRFKEWIMPFLDEARIVSLGEGLCPIVKAGPALRAWIGGDINLWLILEGMTPTGSFKDYGGTVLMSVAKAAGIKAVACASTGDTSAMAAAYAARAEIKAAVILPRGQVTSVQLAQPLAHGAKIITVPGDFDDCMRIMQELVGNYGVYPANSLNPARIEGHQATVFQIAQAFGWKLPNWISVPVGNGSNCSSIGKGLRLLENFGFEPKTRILACQSAAANPLAASWQKTAKNSQNKAYPNNFKQSWDENYKPIKAGETAATAARIGAPVSKNKVMREIVQSRGAMEIASETDLNKAVSVFGQDGYFVCPQTGIALAGVRNAVKKGIIKKGEDVVVVSTATGLKFTESVANRLEKQIINAKSVKTNTVAKLMEV